MIYKRMPIEKESPEERGYDRIVCNLAESSVSDLSYAELSVSLDHLVLGYQDHRGNKKLRHLIVEDQEGLEESQVLVTSGAATALFIVNTSLLTPGDSLVVVRPNYASNIEVPRAIGCSLSYIDLRFEDSWALDLEKISNAITPNTKLISVTTPHNPTGMVMENELVLGLVRLAEEKNIFLLVDETYRDTCLPTPYPLVAAASSQVISIASVSKSLGLPGIRIGWLITKNEWLLEKFLAAKEMISITNSVLDEEIACQVLQKRKYWSDKINHQTQDNFVILKKWLAGEPRLDCVLPQGGCVCFPRFREDIFIRTSVFYDTLTETYQTMVGPGHWFDMPDHYMRIGFGWPAREHLEQGLLNISLAIDAAVQTGH
jgi:aspartate/methionine/tyrosine aminotransferase